MTKTKISQLTSVNSVSDDDILYIGKYNPSSPSGTGYDSRHTTVGKFKEAMGGVGGVLDGSLFTLNGGRIYREVTDVYIYGDDHDA